MRTYSTTLARKWCSKHRLESLEPRFLLAGNTVDGPNADLIYDAASGSVTIDLTDLEEQAITAVELANDQSQLNPDALPEQPDILFPGVGSDTDSITLLGAFAPVNFEQLSLGEIFPAGISDVSELHEFLSSANYGSSTFESFEFDLIVINGDQIPDTEGAAVRLESDKTEYTFGELFSLDAFVFLEDELGSTPLFGVEVVFEATHPDSGELVQIGVSRTNSDGIATAIGAFTQDVFGDSFLGSITLLARTSQVKGSLEVQVAEPGDGNIDGPNADLIYDSATGNVTIDLTDLPSPSIGVFRLEAVSEELTTNELPEDLVTLDRSASEITILWLSTASFDQLVLGSILPAGIPNFEALSNFLITAGYATSPNGALVEFDLVIQNGNNEVVDPRTERVRFQADQRDPYFVGQEFSFEARVFLASEEQIPGYPFEDIANTAVTFAVFDPATGEEVELGESTTDELGIATLSGVITTEAFGTEAFGANGLTENLNIIVSTSNTRNVGLIEVRQLPEFSVANPVFPTELTSGQTATVSFSVHNTGATWSDWSAVVLLVPFDELENPHRRAIGFDTAFAFADFVDGEPLDAVVSLDIPSDIVPGDYAVLIDIEWFEPFEANTDDNTANSGLLTIGSETSPRGDFNGDGEVDAADIDLLAAALQNEFDPAYDLTRDSVLNDADQLFLIEDILHARRGDADLNGRVEFADFLALSAGFGKPGGWASGDFDGDGEVAFADFLVLSQNFGFSIPG